MELITLHGIVGEPLNTREFGVLIWQLFSDSTVFAQYKDTLGTDVQGAWNNFIQSGQVWALLIGIIVGYMFRSFTSY